MFSTRASAWSSGSSPLMVVERCHMAQRACAMGVLSTAIRRLRSHRSRRCSRACCSLRWWRGEKWRSAIRSPRTCRPACTCRNARGGRSHWWTWPPTHPVSRRCRRVFRGLTIRSHRPTHSNSSGLYCVLPPICASKPSGSWTWKLPSVARIFNPRRFSSASTAGLTALSVSQLASVYAM